MRRAGSRADPLRPMRRTEAALFTRWRKASQANAAATSAVGSTEPIFSEILPWMVISGKVSWGHRYLGVKYLGDRGREAH